MKQVWKYTLKPYKPILSIPKGGLIRYVGEQHNEICLWVEVDTDNEAINREFKIYGTGHNIPEDWIGYLGSVKIDEGRLVFHVYEVIS